MPFSLRSFGYYKITLLIFVTQVQLIRITLHRYIQNHLNKTKKNATGTITHLLFVLIILTVECVKDTNLLFKNDLYIKTSVKNIKY